MVTYEKAPVPEVVEDTPPTWAVVHLMGHARYAGRLTEEEKFGVKMGRVDVPNDIDCPRCGGTNPGGDDATCGMCVAGRVGGFRTVYFGGASVYKIEVVTEAVARTVGRMVTPQPVSPWDFPKQLPAAKTACAGCGQDPHDPECPFAEPEPAEGRFLAETGGERQVCIDCNHTAVDGCDAGRCANHCDEKCDTHCTRSAGLDEDDDDF